MIGVNNDGHGFVSRNEEYPNCNIDAEGAIENEESV